MILPRFVRKILAVFRGGVSPVLIFLSVTMGLWFGLLPGWSGFHTVIVILMLLLNIHLGLFLLSAGVGKTLCFATAPALYHIGIRIHDYLPGLLRLLASVPVLGITDLNRYSVAGALVAGPVIGAVAGLLLARSVIGFRRALLKFEEGSEKFRKWYSQRWVRILDRVLIGKRTKDAKALFTVKTRIIRKAGVVLVALVVVLSALIASLVKNDTIRDHATKTLTRANGAEVDLDKLDLSLLTGAVAVSGIQVTDAKKPQNNQVSVEKITADASLYNLLLGRIVMENVEVSNVRFDQERATPGKVEADTGEKPSVFDPCDFKIEAGDIDKLETYFKNAKSIKEWLQNVRKWLPQGKDKDAAAGAKEIPHKYAEYLDARATAGASFRVLAKQIFLDKVQIPSPVFGNSQIRLKNVSDAPQAAGLPVTLELKSIDTSAALDVTFDYSSGAEAPVVSGAFSGLDLSKIQSSLGSNAGLIFERGTASGTFTGKITSKSIDVAIDAAIRDLKAEGQGEGVLGLGSKTTSDALGALNELSTTIRIVGPTSEPRIVFDIKGLTKEFKEALVKAGKQKVAEEIDKQLGKQIDGKLGDKIPDEIKGVLKKPNDLINGLGGLLGGKDKEKDAK
jgi:hypothetical protein